MAVTYLHHTTVLLEYSICGCDQLYQQQLLLCKSKDTVLIKIRVLILARS
jgi:hypothetical protein